MSNITAYIYPNTVECQILDTTIFTTRNRTVYSRPVTIYQGIDNTVQVVMKNQDQKSVDLTGYAVQADIQDPNSQTVVVSHAVTWSNVKLGLGSFTITRNTVNNLEQRFYKMTLKTIRTVDNIETPVYIDDNFGVPLDLRVLPSYYQIALPPLSGNTLIINGGTI